MKSHYILSIDQGTTSSRALIFDEKARIIGMGQREFTQHFPNPGWVEHNPIEIWETQIETIQQAINEAGIKAEDLDCIGITNQRETVVCWNRESGKPLYNAIVWQDTRTSEYCSDEDMDEFRELVREKTGLLINPYFSASKMKWILEHIPGARGLASEDKLCFGTIDTWLMWKLSDGEIFRTDPSNASRTLLYNIHDSKWDDELLKLFSIPKSSLPEVCPSSGLFGMAEIDGIEIPICGVAGDQQAALFGQACFNPGDIKNTYGTGCFMLQNTGKNVIQSEKGLLSTIAWDLGEGPVYATEGSVFIAGAAIQWLRDNLEIIRSASETEGLAREVKESSVYFVPAFSGLGTPHWDTNARGAIFGLTRDSGPAEIAKAALDSIAFQTDDVVRAMAEDGGIPLTSLKVDGGATSNDYLMQFQADLLGIPVLRTTISEATAFGAAALAAIERKIWDINKIDSLNSIQKKFVPNRTEDEISRLKYGWLQAITAVKNFNPNV